MSLRWRLKEADDQKVSHLASALKIAEPVARVLVSRGVSAPEEAERFLRKSMNDLQSPFELPGMDRAAERLAHALRGREKILVHGDFDADGITSAALLTHFLRDIGAEVTPFVPNRLIEGHGISPRAIELSRAQGVKLVVTCDCGSSSQVEIKQLAQMGIETIVTDHHALPSALPTGAYLVNPQLEGTGEEHGGLSGVGVAFMLAVALRARLREQGYFADRPEPNLKNLLDVVALGTLADMAPLNGQNRILVAHGLKQLAISTRPAFLAMSQNAGLSSNPVIRTDDVGFRLAPRLNAAARLGHSSEALELLLSDNLSRAQELASALEGWNQERKDLQERMTRIAAIEALPQVEERSPAIVVSSRDFHPGVIGLVAQKLAAQYGMPAFVFAIEGETAKGSVRSRSGVNVVLAMQECADLLDGFGGHREAAGCSLPSRKLTEFRIRFQKAVAAQKIAAMHEVLIDAELNLRHLNEGVLKTLDAIAPFGMGNPEPVFMTRARAVRPPREVGQGHLRVTLKDEQGGGSFGAIGFGLWKKNSSWSGNGFDVAYTPEFNLYQGREEIQLRIAHLRTV